MGPQDTYGSLATRLQVLGGELLVRTLDLLATGESPVFVEQDEAQVTYAEKIGPEDRLLDPARPASELERVVRALHPHIGARVALGDGTLLGVHRAALAQEASTGRASLEAGEAAGSREGEDRGGTGVSVRDDRLLLTCTPGTLELLEVQPPGGRAMDASAYLRGHGPPGRL
jgi:methionyl-tRNA formyltransferase